MVDQGERKGGFLEAHCKTEYFENIIGKIFLK
jgi:hypothetical protein